MNDSAKKAGEVDAKEWLTTASPEEIEQCLKPGQLGADESLISAVGHEKTAEIFGVATDSEAFSAACAEYNKAWLSVVRGSI